MKAKDNRKRDSSHIKRFAKQKVVLDFHSDVIPRVTHKKKARTGVFLDLKKKVISPRTE